MIGNVLAAEFLKLRRTPVTWLTAAGASFGPLVGALFMIILKDPETARSLGLIGQKAQVVAGTADWATYLALLLQMIGIGGMVLAAIIASYVFGREYAHGTAKNLLALPVPRWAFVAAKLVVVAVWFLALAALMTAEAFALGAVVGLPGYSAALAMDALRSIALVTAAVALLVPATAWIALAGRGFFAPLGFTFFTLVLGNVFAATGWGAYFPWSIVPLYAGAAGPPQEFVAAGSWLILVLSGAAATAGTIVQLQRADNAQ